MTIEPARPAIDLTRYWFVRELGDIRLYGTWLYHEDEDDDEPALVLVPAFRSGGTPCVVALSAAFKYDDPRYLAAKSLEFALDLGFDDSQLTTAQKIGSIIHDHLLDLIKMPENPTEEVVAATASVDFGDGRRHTLEIIDHEPKRQC